jgi:hypothetical protein
MAFRNLLVPAGLRGAGYDDQYDDNNNAYRNTDGIGEEGPTCGARIHRGTDRKFILTSPANASGSID